MLKLLVVLFCVLVMLCNETYGAQFIQEPVPKPPKFADQEGCYDPELEIVLPFEVPFDNHECSRHLCKENGNIVISTCGAISVLNGETLLKGDRSLPYPDCCDSIDMSSKPKTY